MNTTQPESEARVNEQESSRAREAQATVEPRCKCRAESTPRARAASAGWVSDPACQLKRFRRATSHSRTTGRGGIAAWSDELDFHEACASGSSQAQSRWCIATGPVQDV